MNASEQLKELMIRQEALQNQIKNCNHEYNEPVYDAEIKKEFTYTTVARGSDIYPEINGSYDKTIDRWSRTCKKCGKVEYTYKQEAVISSYQPKF